MDHLLTGSTFDGEKPFSRIPHIPRMQKGHLSENELTFLEDRFRKIFEEKHIYDECKEFIERLQGILSYINKGKFAKEYRQKKRRNKKGWDQHESMSEDDIDLT
mmetsp:Transcript_29382/g.44386  ORF Transcript_29382/g.44386 Transcript_29382/m.44386 type:complete len:104 (-) Transcript_29382:1448-1759(-)|eukprot:CAMPEP_0170496544 /NCGR_PEP_ID=MMETSP0208-20121228/22043_1 /TAXON_ID=197538 /ORGANISM="Strombidium inclinatum, Strain S3" /LENGTH=103 /DNA_ID=CAMNT_0010773125 /DNA_START=780 /DNA_END=1091 /DNA_ORIENTATION=+